MIILASQSTTRKSLLDQAGIGFTAIRAAYDEEHARQTFEAKRDNCLALYLATGKALSLSAAHNNALIIGADQTLHCAGQLFHKPGNRAAASLQLKKLRGKTHTLTSAVVCVKNKQILWNHVSAADISMRQFSDEALEKYLDTSSETVFQSVGSYHYEGTGIQLIESISGDYHTILGFPLLPLLGFLRAHGYVAT